MHLSDPKILHKKGNAEVAYEYFFSCKSTNQNKTFIDLKSVKLEK